MQYLLTTKPTAHDHCRPVLVSTKTQLHRGQWNCDILQLNSSVQLSQDHSSKPWWPIASYFLKQILQVFILWYFHNKTPENYCLLCQMLLFSWKTAYTTRKQNKDNGYEYDDEMHENSCIRSDIPRISTVVFQFNFRVRTLSPVFCTALSFYHMQLYIHLRQYLKNHCQGMWAATYKLGSSSMESDIMLLIESTLQETVKHMNAE